jgi:DNA polymerase IIIc chi subunit
MQSTFNFYKLLESSLLTSAISTISSKVMEFGEKTIVFFETDQEMNQVDEKLWTFSQSEFMPHLCFNAEEFEEFKDEVPLLLTTQKQNDIEAENLIILKPFNEVEFFINFKKIFFLFSSENQEELTNARNFWKEIASKKDKFASKFYEQGEDKKWKLKA